MEVIETNPEIAHSLTTLLPLLPLKNVVLLPKSIIPIIVGRPLSIKAVDYAFKTSKMLFITAQKDAKTELPTPQDVFAIGTKATILQVIPMPNGALKILAEGICRAQALSFETTDGFMSVHCQDIATNNTHNIVELEALWRQLHHAYQTYAKFNDKAPTEISAI